MSLGLPLTELIPDRCTPELRRLQAELSARHSYREAAQLLERNRQVNEFEVGDWVSAGHVDNP